MALTNEQLQVVASVVFTTIGNVRSTYKKFIFLKITDMVMVGVFEVTSLSCMLNAAGLYTGANYAHI
jgi:hypothetical protein